MEMVGTLLDRPAIHANFQHKYPLLVAMCDEELQAVKKLFDAQLALTGTPSGPVVHKNMPPVAGVLRWSNELRERTDQMMEQFKTVNHG